MKKILLTICICLLSTVAIAQNAVVGDGFYVIDDFSGMMTSHVADHLIKKGYAKEALNVRPNEEYGRLTKRSPLFLLTTTPDSAIKSLFRHYVADNTKYTIATYGTNVSYYNDSGTEKILFSNATSAKRWSFVTYKDKLIGMNGSDRAKKWDQKVLVDANTDEARTSGDLMADLGAPFADLDDGSGGNDLDAEKWYQYKVAFCSDTTCTASASFTYSDARSNPIKTGTSGTSNIYLTDIPLGASGTESRYIYRTEGQADRSDVTDSSVNFYLVDTLSDNETQVYADAKTDLTISGDDTPTWATVSAGSEVSPPMGKYCIINTERLFIGNDPSSEYQDYGGKSTIYWSDVLNPDYFNALVDYDLVRPDDGDNITFLKNVLGILTIGKTRTINKFYTTASSSSDWYFKTISDGIGCIAPYSAVNAQGGVIYLGRYGLFSFNGQSSQLISDAVTDKIRDFLSTSVDDIAGVYHDNRYLMAYTSEESGGANNNRVLVLDLVRNSYYEDTLNIDSFAVFDSGDDFGTLYSGSSESDGNIYAHKNTFNRIIYRYKSQFNGGTFDSTRVYGSEDSPIISLGDDETWAESTDNWEDSGSKTWMVNDLTGEWYSPTIQVDATEYDKLYWNEKLGATGDITFAIRSAATSGGVASASWSSEFTDPSGDDLSGESANDYLQLRASLSSSLYTETPELYLLDAFVTKLTYKKEGTTAESSILTIWESGDFDMEGGEYPKRIREIHVYYEGTDGTLNFQFDNLQGDSYDFDIDLSVDPDAVTDDNYYGNGDKKIYVHIPSFENVPTGRRWNITITENGTETWDIDRVVFRRELNKYTTFK